MNPCEIINCINPPSFTGPYGSFCETHEIDFRLTSLIIKFKTLLPSCRQDLREMKLSPEWNKYMVYLVKQIPVFSKQIFADHRNGSKYIKSAIRETELRLRSFNL